VIKLLTAENTPSHVAVIASLESFARIHENGINLVVMPLEELEVFQVFKAHAEKFYPKKFWRVDFHTAEAAKSFGKISRRKNRKIPGGVQVSRMLEDFAGEFRHQTAARQLMVRVFGNMGPVTTMRPHIDSQHHIRGFADLSQLGMLFFDQTDMSVQDRIDPSVRCYNATDFGPSEAVYTSMADRLYLCPAPAFYMFKGGGSDNPLLHATCPARLRQRADLPSFRPCWRLDSYII